MTIRLGKITSIKLGIADGYQFGLFIIIESKKDCWGVQESKWFHDFNKSEWNSNCRWTKEENNKTAIEMLKFISDLLNQAKKNYLHELINVPVECVFDGNKLQSFRILEEVL